MAGPLRWMKRAGVAVAMLVSVSGAARAQYYFNYTVFSDYTAAGDGSPFSSPVCTGVTASINYDNNPGTLNPKTTTLCPGMINAAGNDFGAQFSAWMFTWTPGFFDFYVGTGDGSSLFIDGVDVLDMPGIHGYQSNTVSVFLSALSHTYLLNYFADDVDVFPYSKAVQTMVDPRLNVTLTDETLNFLGSVPEPSSLVLALTGFGIFAGAARMRRNRAAAAR